MDRQKFKIALILSVSQVIERICERQGMSEIDATQSFYNSLVYSSLENERTKVWHFGPETLYSMFEEEQEKGSFVFPVEV